MRLEASFHFIFLFVSRLFGGRAGNRLEYILTAWPIKGRGRVVSEVDWNQDYFYCIGEIGPL
jgi:hypothetical protein